MNRTPGSSGGGVDVEGDAAAASGAGLFMFQKKRSEFIVGELAAVASFPFLSLHMPNTLDAAAAVRQGGGQGGVGERLNCSNQGIEQVREIER